MYSTALPPAVCAAVEAAIGIIQAEPHRIRELQQRSQVLRDLLRAREVEVLAKSTGPIVPIPLQDSQRAVDVANRLEERGYLVGAIRPPTVPRGTSRLRISVNLGVPEDSLPELAKVVAEESRTSPHAR
jgi:8-amino-7-oxononanoate synthase